MQISKKDVLWNYAATFLKIASSVLLLPFILKMMPSQEVGIWSIFMTITAFSTVLDFGFGPSFTRNITYVYSGVKFLKKLGYETIPEEDYTVDYGLLKGVIVAMRWFYLRMAIVLFLILATFGTYYIYILLQHYQGDKSEVYIAWGLLCVINTYNLFTLYYDSLLQGKGLIKRSKQIIIVGQIAYLIIATIFILSGKGLIAIISAQAVSVIIIRILSHYSFFTRETKQKLRDAVSRSRKEILNAIAPNSIKIGLTSLGSFVIQRSAIFIGSLYLTLDDIASYGITNQIITMIASLAAIYTTTYIPKISQLRVKQDDNAIKEVYLKGEFVLLGTYLLGGLALLFLGKWALNLIGSQTLLLPQMMMLLAIIVSFLEINHSVAGAILLTKNEVPFFKASLFSAGLTILLLLLFFKFLHIGIWAMIAAPGIAQVIYQNWKWPLVVAKELKITFKDVFKTISGIFDLKKYKIVTL